MLTVNDVEIRYPPKEVLDLVERYADPELACPWSQRAWPGRGLFGLTAPTGFRVPRKIVVNRLCWPRGASDWGYIFLVMSAQTLNVLAPQAFGADGTEQNHVTLRMTSPDSRGESEEVLIENMWMLPPKPISCVVPSGGIPQSEDQVVDTNNVYLVPLVDDRYYWWEVNVGNISIDAAGGIDWADLIAPVRDAIDGSYPGINFEHDDIPTEYLKASVEFVLPYEPAPVILDAIAANLGMKICRTFDGRTLMQTETTARTALQDNFDNHPGRVVISGGHALLDRIKYH